MAKNFLATFGLLCMVLLLISAVGAMGALYDWAGLVKLPNGVRDTLAVLAEEVQRTPEPTFRVNGSPVEEAQWTNPLESLAVLRPTQTDLPTNTPTEPPTSTPEPTETPLPTSTPEPTATPTPTQTPIPPLEPGIYQSQTMARLQDFAESLQRWMKANNELAKDNALKDNAGWRARMQVSLEDIQNTSRSLAEIGPAPEEYQRIDDWFERIEVEADEMANLYREAIETGDEGQFVAASREFTQIKEDLAQVVAEMQAAGWNLE